MELSLIAQIFVVLFLILNRLGSNNSIIHAKAPSLASLYAKKRKKRRVYLNVLGLCSRLRPLV